MNELVKVFYSQVGRFLLIYWGALILLMYGVEFVGKHAVAFAVASSVVAFFLVVFAVMRWRRRRYW